MAPLARLTRMLKTADIWPILRGFGLRYFEALRGDGSETPKKVLTKSISHICGRNAVHILPIIVLIALIWLNYVQYFIGPTFIVNADKNNWFLAGIQICAKLEELLCVASLATIVLQALRHELLHDGLPIGLLGSGIWFSSLSAFWSPEFLGSWSWKRPSSWQLPKWSRLRFYVILVICGLLAVLIGPQSAVLMLPRLQNVPIGGVSYHVDGASDQFWPSTVTADTELDVCGSANATLYAFCPSGGYGSLSSTLTAEHYISYCQEFGEAFSPLCQAKGAEGNRQWRNFLIRSPNNLIPPVLNSIRRTTWASQGYTAIQPHAASVVRMHQLRNLAMENTKKFKTQSTRQYRWTYDVDTRGAAISPFVRTKCTLAQNLSASIETAEFPYVARTDPSRWVPGTDVSTITDWALSTTKSASIVGVKRDESANIRTQWLPLPIDKFGVEGTTLNASGLLIELPWVDGYRIGIGCTVYAAWHDATVQSRRATSYGAWNIALSGIDFTDNVDSPDWDTSNIPVTLDQSWLDILMPESPALRSDPDDHYMNTFERILDDAYISQLSKDIRTRYSCPREPHNTTMSDTELWNTKACKWIGYEFIQQSLAMIVTDGLSRYGSHRIANTTAEVRDWAWTNAQTFNKSRVFHDDNPRGQLPDFPSSWMVVDAVGYAYYANARSDYFATAIVGIYMSVALCHVFYTIFRRRNGTSTAWDSITELLVLCQNSPPPISDKLENTSAGIAHTRTYRSVVKVRAFPPPEGESGQPKLRLVLEDDLQSLESASTAASSDGSSLRYKYSHAEVSGNDIELTPASSLAPLRPRGRSDSRQSDQAKPGMVVKVDEEYA